VCAHIVGKVAKREQIPSAMLTQHTHPFFLDERREKRLYYFGDSILSFLLFLPLYNGETNEREKIEPSVPLLPLRFLNDFCYLSRL